MKPDDLKKAVLPGIIAGGILYVISTLVGPGLGPGWRDVLQGLSVVVGMTWVGIAVLRLLVRRTRG
jgi:hypothetical protein